MILSLIFIALAAACYGVVSRIEHGSSNLSYGPHADYWSRDNLRKYKLTVENHLIDAPHNFYYRVNKIYYKEKFPLSATILVFLTDGFHLLQFFMIKFFILAIIFSDPQFIWWQTFLIIWATWLLMFNLTYEIFKNK